MNAFSRSTRSDTAIRELIASALFIAALIHVGSDTAQLCVCIGVLIASITLMSLASRHTALQFRGVALALLGLATFVSTFRLLFF